MMGFDAVAREYMEEFEGRSLPVSEDSSLRIGKVMAHREVGGMRIAIVHILEDPYYWNALEDDKHLYREEVTWIDLNTMGPENPEYLPGSLVKFIPCNPPEIV